MTRAGPCCGDRLPAAPPYRPPSPRPSKPAALSLAASSRPPHSVWGAPGAEGSPALLWAGGPAERS